MKLLEAGSFWVVCDAAENPAKKAQALRMRPCSCGRSSMSGVKGDGRGRLPLPFESQIEQGKFFRWPRVQPGGLNRFADNCCPTQVAPFFKR